MIFLVFLMLIIECEIICGAYNLLYANDDQLVTNPTFETNMDVVPLVPVCLFLGDVTMSELTDDIFRNSGILPREEFAKYRVKALEDINADLQQYSGWDSVSPVACMVLNQEEGAITQCILHLEGETDPKIADAKALLGPQYPYEKHQVMIGKIKLASLRFHGSMMSDWVSTADFDYTVQRPSTVDPTLMRDLDRTKVQEDGGLPLWLEFC